MKILLKLGTVILSLMTATLTSAGNELPSHEMMLASGPDAFSTIMEDGSDSHAEIVNVSGMSFDKAWRVDVSKNVQSMFSVQLAAYSKIAVEKGGAALLHVYMRSLATADETGRGRVFVLFRQKGMDSNSSLISTLDAGTDWQDYYLPFTMVDSYSAGDAVLRLFFGFPGQRVEVGGAEILYFGNTVDVKDLPRTRFTYEGRAPDAQWRKDAFKRIDRIRKGNLTVHVVDKNGKEVPNANVKVHQTRSAFEFGTCIQLVRLTGNDPDDETYRDHILELFNAGSPENDLKWPVWLGEWNSIGNYDNQKAIDGLKWLQAHGLDTRGHVLVWPGWKNLPEPVKKMHDDGRDSEILPLIDRHIQEMAAATKGLVTEWDVLNEPFTNHDLMDIFGDSVMVHWFQVAREAMPGVRLVFNDFSNHDDSVDPVHCAHFEKTIRYLQSNGAPMDMIGLQAHIGSRPEDPEQILSTLDRYDQADGNLPIRFTEFDVRTDDDELQADYMRDFLIMAYSHPTVIGVQLWGFWEKCHWIPPAAMYRSDWSEKLAAGEYKDLVLKQWRTNVDGKTDSNGTMTLRGFQGDYTVEIEAAGKKATVVTSIKPGATDSEVSVTLEP